MTQAKILEKLHDTLSPAPEFHEILLVCHDLEPKLKEASRQAHQLAQIAQKMGILLKACDAVADQAPDSKRQTRRITSTLAGLAKGTKQFNHTHSSWDDTVSHILDLVRSQQDFATRLRRLRRRARRLSRAVQLKFRI